MNRLIRPRRARAGHGLREGGPSRPPRAWLIDLDNTLHDAVPEIMPRINRDMTGFVMRALELDEARASEVRQRYWRRYGATLLGLVRHHDVDAHRFLRDTHVFPDMAELVARSTHLAAMLRRLPGRRLIVTNAPRHYAHAVLRELGILPMVHGVIPIEEMRFAGRWLPKPSRPMLRRILARHRLDPRRCAMVEDSPENLRAAKALGIRTVLVNGWAWKGRAGSRPLAGRGRRIDYQIQSALTLPRVALR